MKSFDHLRAAGAQAQNETSAAKIVQGQCAHGRHGRGARCGLHDACSQLDGMSLVCKKGQGGHRVAPPSFCSKGHVDAQTFSKLNPLNGLLDFVRGDGTHFDSEFHLWFFSGGL